MEKSIDEVIEEARNEAIKRVSEERNPSQISFEFYVREMMKQILKEKGIEWEANEGSITIDKRD